MQRTERLQALEILQEVGRLRRLCIASSRIAQVSVHINVETTVAKNDCQTSLQLARTMWAAEAVEAALQKGEEQRDLMS